MLLHADAVSGTVGEVFPVTCILDHLSCCKVKFLESNTWFDLRNGSFVCAANCLVNFALFLADALIENGSGHIAPVVIERRTDIDYDAVAFLQNSFVCIMMWVCSIFTHTYNRESQTVAASCFKEVFHLEGKLFFCNAFPNCMDYHIHTFIVDQRSFSHALTFFFVFVHSGLFYWQGAHYWFYIRAQLH